MRHGVTVEPPASVWHLGFDWVQVRRSSYPSRCASPLRECSAVPVLNGESTMARPLSLSGMALGCPHAEVLRMNLTADSNATEGPCGPGSEAGLRVRVGASDLRAPGCNLKPRPGGSPARFQVCDGTRHDAGSGQLGTWRRGSRIDAAASESGSGCRLAWLALTSSATVSRFDAPLRSVSVGPRSRRSADRNQITERRSPSRSTCFLSSTVQLLRPTRPTAH